MAVHVKEFVFAANTDAGAPTDATYSVADVPITGVCCGIWYKSGVGFVCAIRGDWNIVPITNPGGTRIYKHYLQNSAYQAVDRYIGTTMWEYAGEIRHWFEDD